jgi:hypothetical protein
MGGNKMEGDVLFIPITPTFFLLSNGEEFSDGLSITNSETLS